MTSFLGLPTHARDSFGSHNALRYDAEPETTVRLREHFRPHNRDLYELLGTDYGWDSPRSGAIA